MTGNPPHKHLPWLLASLIAGISYYVIKDLPLPGVYQVVWKGAGVGFLAAYAWFRNKLVGARTIALVMILGALGDVLIEFSLEAGAAVFLFGHLIAIRFYWRHRRANLALEQIALAIAMLVLVPSAAFMLPGNRGGAPLVALYAVGLSAMAASAWTSTFARHRVGIGAMMFVASDLFIFARDGALANSAVLGMLIWPLYYFGQFLICTGVLDGLNFSQASRVNSDREAAG